MFFAGVKCNHQDATGLSFLAMRSTASKFLDIHWSGI